MIPELGLRGWKISLELLVPEYKEIQKKKKKRAYKKDPGVGLKRNFFISWVIMDYKPLDKMKICEFMQQIGQ